MTTGHPFFSNLPHGCKYKLVNSREWVVEELVFLRLLKIKITLRRAFCSQPRAASMLSHDSQARSASLALFHVRNVDPGLQTLNARHIRLKFTRNSNPNENISLYGCDMCQDTKIYSVGARSSGSFPS